MGELVSDRRFETASDGSDITERFCTDVLEPWADSLVGNESFKESGVNSVITMTQLEFTQFEAVRAEFSARITGVDEDGKVGTTYNIAITFLRRRKEGEYWPVKGVDYEGDDDEDDMDESEGGIMLLDEDDEEPDVAEFPAVFRVQEVWDYYVDDDWFRPRRSVRFEYYDEDDDCFCFITGDSYQRTSRKLLSEVPEEDVDLQVNNALFSQSFSEFDMALMEAVRQQDTRAIREMIEKIGGMEHIDPEQDNVDLDSDADEVPPEE